MAEQRNNALRGCIKPTKGPWLVRRENKDGSIVTKYRYPSEKERRNNRERERKRRATTHKIFAGLRAHGNYDLPTHADSNDLLKALCNEAGWHVDEDGTVSRKKLKEKTPILINVESPISIDTHDYCRCSEAIVTKDLGEFYAKWTSNRNAPLDVNLNLCL